MNARGITLVEMMVGTFVLGIVGAIIVNVYLSAGQFSSNEQLRIDIDLSASRLLGVMDQYLRQGKRVEDNHTFSGTPYTSGDTTLVFTIPTLLSSGSLSSTEVDYAVFYMSGTDLKFELEPHDDIDNSKDSTRTAQNRVITSNVRDVFFRYNAVTLTAATAVTVTLTTQKTVSGKPYTQASILNVTLRNHP